MSLADSDYELVVSELGREPTPAEEALFENLWSEHCAYRSSRPLLSAFESEGERVVIGPGDDAAVVSLPTPAGDEDDPVYVTLGIESHNHPSYVDPFDGAATGVGGIVRDTLSMGAYPIALTDSLYFGEFDREHSKYLFEGVVEGISHYGNCIGVPTVGGSVDFHPDYEGNPLVNVACVGLTTESRLVTAEAQEPGNKLVLVGNATGRDGLGGASFASEDLAEDAETEDRPAVQVGDPYAEKLLIEANEVLIEEGLVESARDLGAAGLGGASSELVAKGGLGAHVELDRVHQREPNMRPLEILLAESQERMCYEVRPADVDRVRTIAERFDLGCSVIGEVTEGNYVCTFPEDEDGRPSDGDDDGSARVQDDRRSGSNDDGPIGADADRRVVVDVDAEFLGEGAPMNDLPMDRPTEPDIELPDLTEIDLQEAFERVVASPNTASKRWVYRQYDHEVGTRTALGPGDDAAIVAVREAAGSGDEDGIGLAISAGGAPNWTSTAPYEGARAVALENATNLAAKGARPLAAVDCLNGGNPEKPDVYGGFAGIVDGLADMCRTLSVPIVGGNVSLYNDSTAGPIPPTPTLAMVGTKSGFDAPGLALESEADTELVLVDAGDAVAEGDVRPPLGGSEFLHRFGGCDRFPPLPSDPAALLDAIAMAATHEATLATHDVSHGGLAVSLAEMCQPGAGADVSIDTSEPIPALFSERPGRTLIQTTDAERLVADLGEACGARSIGRVTDDGVLTIQTSDASVRSDTETIAAVRSTISAELE